MGGKLNNRNLRTVLNKRKEQLNTRKDQLDKLKDQKSRVSHSKSVKYNRNQWCEMTQIPRGQQA